MKKYTNENDIHVMISERGSKTVNFNVKKPSVLEVGDVIYVNKRKTIEIAEILETRKSSLKDYNYVQTLITNPF